MRFLDNPTGALRAVSIASGIIPDGPGRPTLPGGGDGPTLPGPGGGPGGGGGGGGWGGECTWEKQIELQKSLDAKCDSLRATCKAMGEDNTFSCSSKVNPDCSIDFSVECLRNSGGDPEPKDDKEPDGEGW